MKVLRDFRCQNGHINERFLDSEIETVPCGLCDSEATRTLGYGTIILDGTDPSLPGAWERWANTREKRHRQTAEKNRRDGKM